MPNLRELYYSDNLPVLRGMESESIDLIYLDPPFNSNRAYTIIYPGDLGQVTAFEDTWFWTPQCDEYLSDMLKFSQRGSKAALEAHSILSALVSAMGEVQLNAYLINMAVRLIEMHRILKPTGSIYLHCDPTASHYLKIIMDRVFGGGNFKNEIVWHYGSWTNAAKHFQHNHDIIMFYTKSNKYNFSRILVPRQNPKPYNIQGGKVNQLLIYRRADTPDRVIQNAIKKGRKIIDVDDGMNEHDVWTYLRNREMDQIQPRSNERLGYPTQKPLALLKRIVEASSMKGDIVLDPFCGCGTTIAAAEILKRQWIGIDIAYSAIGAIKERFKRQKLNVWGDIEIKGAPETVQQVDAKLLDKNSPLYARKEFEKFCVSTIGGLPNDKMGADGGIDGIIPLLGEKIAIVSVKSGHVGVQPVRELRGLLNERRVVGVFITREEPSKAMVDYANQAGLHEFSDILAPPVPKIQILTLKEILGGEVPKLPESIAEKLSQLDSPH